MKTEIKTIEQLRKEVLKTFQKLCSGKMDINEAGVIAKLSETVISGLKTELEYARLTNEPPHIPFLNASVKVIDNKIKKIELVK